MRNCVLSAFAQCLAQTDAPSKAGLSLILIAQPLSLRVKQRLSRPNAWGTVGAQYVLSPLYSF